LACISIYCFPKFARLDSKLSLMLVQKFAVGAQRSPIGTNYLTAIADGFTGSTVVEMCTFANFCNNGKPNTVMCMYKWRSKSKNLYMRTWIQWDHHFSWSWGFSRLYRNKNMLNIFLWCLYYWVYSRGSKWKNLLLSSWYNYAKWNPKTNPHRMNLSFVKISMNVNCGCKDPQNIHTNCTTPVLNERICFCPGNLLGTFHKNR